jgi:energy-coupling factor transporter ATP-binding protein EcfA2
MTKDSNRSNAKAIAKITVVKLFGSNTYDIPPLGTDSKRLSTLMLLYGDNGSGKTTILKMLYSILSPAHVGGFKTLLAKTPFESFSVSLVDGTTFAAVRPPGDLIGSFELSLTWPDGKARKMLLRANSENVIKMEGVEEREYIEFLSDVRKLGIAFYYLSDDRRLQRLHGPDDIEDDDEESERRVFRMTRRNIIMSDWELRNRATRGLSLEPSVKAFVAWTRHQALRASNVGEGNTNTIYADLIRRITSAYDPSFEPAGEKGLGALRDRLGAIAERSGSYVELGLISRPPVEELISETGRVDARSVPIVSRVLAPYVEGLEARLNALQELRDVLTTFIFNLNDLYSGKKVTYKLSHGLRIYTSNGAELRPEYLSSGEKQLLVLLCNTVIARDQTSIFVIDEPELSLNIKWQRKLVKTLLDGVSGSAVQFILATHSIELLSAYQESVVKLEASEWPSLNAKKLVS